MRVGIDVDDVVLDLLAPWLKRIARVVGKPGQPWTPDDLTQWEFWNDIGVDKQVAWDALTPDIYTEVQPTDGAAWAMREIRGMGHTVVFVTSSKDKDTFQQKVLRLLETEVGTLKDEYVAIGKWADYQSKDDPRLNLHMLVDDFVGNLEGFPGIRVLMTRSHNRRLFVSYKRVRTLADVVAMLRYRQEEAPLPLLRPAEPPKIDETYDYAADHCAGGACWTKPVNIGGELIDMMPAFGDTVPEVEVKWPMVPPVNQDPNDHGVVDMAGRKAHEEKVAPGLVRVFTTGATRDTDDGKLDYEGFLSPLVLRRFAEFMHKNRYQRDGSIRDSDNWQKGIPLDAYMKSLFRHFMEVWLLHRGQPAVDEKGRPVDLETALAAVIFNAQGYLHETLKAKSLQDKVA